MNLQNTTGGRLSSADEMKGEGGGVRNYPEPGIPEVGPEPDYVTYVFVFLGITIIYQ
jgi:hypothetical protein